MMSRAKRTALAAEFEIAAFAAIKWSKVRGAGASAVRIETARRERLHAFPACIPSSLSQSDIYGNSESRPTQLSTCGRHAKIALELAHDY